MRCGVDREPHDETALPLRVSSYGSNGGCGHFVKTVRAPLGRRVSGCRPEAMPQARTTRGLDHWPAMSHPEHTPTAAAPDAEIVDGKIVDARRREMAVEHIVFGTVRFLAERHPELLDQLDRSLDHLWDHERGEARDDEAVRTIARKIIKSLRAESSRPAAGAVMKA